MGWDKVICVAEDQSEEERSKVDKHESILATWLLRRDEDGNKQQEGLYETVQKRWNRDVRVWKNKVSHTISDLKAQPDDWDFLQVRHCNSLGLLI